MEGWDLALRGEAAQAEGAFSLRLTPEEATRRLALDLNITQADALFLGAYLPEKLEPGLRGWLLEAVRGGRVERGKFVLYGPMKPERKEARAPPLPPRCGKGDFARPRAGRSLRKSRAPFGSSPRPPTVPSRGQIFRV